MALNVMLVFFHHYQAPQLRRLEKYYLCFSYGLPAIPAITYIIMHHVSRPVLGGATVSPTFLAYILVANKLLDLVLGSL
jgi:hypothetical protein